MTKPKRPAMTPKRRLEVWEARKGICYLCGKKVMAGEPWDVEHRLAYALSEDDTLSNLEVAHREGCHKAKTAKDAGIIAKADRQGMKTGQQARRARNGPTMKSGPFPKSKGKTKWPKRPMSKGKQNETTT